MVAPTSFKKHTKPFSKLHSIHHFMVLHPDKSSSWSLFQLCEVSFQPLALELFVLPSLSIFVWCISWFSSIVGYHIGDIDSKGETLV